MTLSGISPTNKLNFITCRSAPFADPKNLYMTYMPIWFKKFMFFCFARLTWKPLYAFNGNPVLICENHDHQRHQLSILLNHKINETYKDI